MHLKHISKLRAILIALMAVAVSVHAQVADDQIILNAATAEDQYLAGKSINVLAPVNGDVIAAGQRLAVEATVSDDVIAAGERIAIRADIGDDVRLAARQVDVSGSVADDAVVAGETVILAKESRVGNRFWAAGRLVEVNGEVGSELRVAGQSIVIGGTIGGDATLVGQRIEILPTARISGNLVYRSNQPAVIADGATIGGTVEQKPLETPEKPDVPAWPFAIGLLLSLLVCLNVLYWLLRRRMHDAEAVIRSDTFRALGVGLAVVLVMPVVAIILLVTVLGIPLGLILLLLYPVLLFLGFAAGILWLAARLLSLLMQVDIESAGRRILGTLVALIVFVISQIIPLVGTLVFVFLLLAGVGALVISRKLN